MIHFTGDTHFGHRLMAKLRGFAPGVSRAADVPLEAVARMNAWLLAEWNARVRGGDTVYHVGDVSFMNPRYLGDFVRQLRGRVRLVPGNHDHRQTLKVLEAAGWEVLPPIYRLDEAKHQFLLSHEPMATWRGAGRGVIHLHGHSHGNLHGGDERTRRSDVGVDGHWGPGPVSVEQIIAIVGKRRYRPVDHHIAKIG